MSEAADQRGHINIKTERQIFLAMQQLILDFIGVFEIKDRVQYVIVEDLCRNAACELAEKLGAQLSTGDGASAEKPE